MKRFLCVLLLLALLPLPGMAAQKEESLPKALTLVAGKFYAYKLPFSGYWESSDPQVAGGEGNVITACAPGQATLTLTAKKGNKQTEVQVTVLPLEDTPVPESIRRAIEIGIQEWEEAGGEPFRKEPKHNKFTKWWGAACEWCGAFVNYCLDMAGVPLEPSDTYKKLKPLGSGEPHGVREAAPYKLDPGFPNMDRVSKIPRPGYLVIYGRRETKQQSAYAFVHVGMITDVVDRGGGVYQIFTVEGNLASRIKRFSYLYDIKAPANANIFPTPEGEWDQPELYQYTYHTDSWYVTEFCQTWY